MNPFKYYLVLSILIIGAAVTFVGAGVLVWRWEAIENRLDAIFEKTTIEITNPADGIVITTSGDHAEVRVAVFIRTNRNGEYATIRFYTDTNPPVYVTVPLNEEYVIMQPIIIENAGTHRFKVEVDYLNQQEVASDEVTFDWAPPIGGDVFIYDFAEVLGSQVPTATLTLIIGIAALILPILGAYLAKGWGFLGGLVGDAAAITAYLIYANTELASKAIGLISFVMVIGLLLAVVFYALSKGYEAEAPKSRNITMQHGEYKATLNDSHKGRIGPGGSATERDVFEGFIDAAVTDPGERRLIKASNGIDYKKD